MKDKGRALVVMAVAVALLSPAFAWAQAPAAAPAGEAPAKAVQKREPPAQKRVARVKLKVGDPAPDLELKTLDGKDFKLSAHLAASKKTTVFIVGQSACTNCRAELEFINAEAPKHPQLDFIVVNVDAMGGTEKGNEVLTKYFSSLGNKLPVLIDPKFSAPGAFGVRATPGMFVIGKDGKFLETLTGYTSEDNAEFSDKFAALQ